MCNVSEQNVKWFVRYRPGQTAGRAALILLSPQKTYLIFRLTDHIGPYFNTNRKTYFNTNRKKQTI